MGKLAFSLLLFLVSATSSRRVALESTQTLPHNNGWTLLGSADRDAVTSLVFALKQSNLDVLEKLFWEVSDPRSTEYGKHLTLEQIAELVQPHPTVSGDVMRWLQSHGVTECNEIITRDFIKCRMPVQTAERLLETKFAYYQHVTEKDRVILRAQHSYSVPRELHGKLDFIGGVHRVPNVGSKLKIKSIRSVDEVDDDVTWRYGVHPDVLRKRYNVTDLVGSNPNNSMATAQFLGQYYSAADLKEFMNHFGKGFPHLKEVAKVVGPNKGKTGLEANLDVQYIMALGSQIPLTFWSTGKLHEGQEPFLKWMIDLSNTSSIPPIFSVSYGDHERTLSPDYMKRINVEFQKIGLRGVSLLFASGDDGAGCHELPDGSSTYEPDFPASSPYVTTVGGTMFTGVFSDNNEKGNDLSGGGFSNIFPMPKYQIEATSAYLNTTANLPDEKNFNRTGRAYPDISALSDNFWIIINRLIMNVAGTSAATPTVAGMVGLANDARLTAGKPTLGFLNPWIYQNTEPYFDVALGSKSAACIFSDLEGWPIGEGWDPYTGFGSPDARKLIAAALEA